MTTKRNLQLKRIAHQIRCISVEVDNYLTALPPEEDLEGEMERYHAQEMAHHQWRLSSEIDAFLKGVRDDLLTAKIAEEERIEAEAKAIAEEEEADEEPSTVPEGGVDADSLAGQEEAPS